MLDVVDLARVALGSYPQPAPAVELPPLPAETVLIVAEAVTTRTLARGILEEAGYHVVVATGGEEALDVLVHLAQDGGCSLVVVDGNMSGLDGYKLTEQLRADSRFQYLPVLLITEAGSQSERERGLAAGADAYIVKHSFDKDILLDTVAELM
jgi:two-component system chemotaxis sensor kinase CheA